MDFSNHGTQPQAAPSPRSAAPSSIPRKSKNDGEGKWVRISILAVVVAIVVLLIALIAFVGFGGNSDNESKYVDTNRLQAVFLNTGQVYFGNIKTLNSKYTVLTNIYYLQTTSSGSSSSSSSAATNVTLVKLGCELHQPYDQMVINRSQITFWENLQPTGQVAKAVSTFQKDNPSGQKCSDQSSSSSSSDTNSVQSAGSSNGSSSTGTGTTSTTGSTTGTTGSTSSNP